MYLAQRRETWATTGEQIVKTIPFLYQNQDTDDTSISRDPNLLQLQIAFEQVQQGLAFSSAFVEVIQGIDWSTKPVTFFEQAIRMAIALEGVAIARELTRIGTELYPENVILERLSRILAPPRIVVTERSAKPGLSASMEWLQQHAENYRGLWVAILDGELVDTAAARRDLIEKLSNIDLADILITRIP